MKAGFLFRWWSAWIGFHYSKFNKRLCINLLPFCTIWIVWDGGEVPKRVKL